MDNTLYKLVNPEFDFEFAGKQYHLRKATLDKAVLYQQKVKELIDAKDPAADLKITAYCIFILLRDLDPQLTEDFVIKNIPADIDTVECLITLGFINPRKAEITRRIQGQLVDKSISDKSSSS